MISIKEDIPILSLSQDELGRTAIVHLMVDAIKNSMSHSHPAMTMGVYGAWGEGKTSVMQMVKTELKAAHIETIWYNPWSVADEHQILMEFFSLLSTFAFDDSTIPSAIENYGRLFLTSSVNGSYSPVVASYLTRLAQCLPESGKNLLDIKTNISKRLMDSRKYPVIFIDDVDRLSNNEIRIIFKLLRQIADFDNVTYVVGLDPAAVVDALYSSCSASGDKFSRGREFLAKIIQVPIVLPSIDETILQDQLKKMLLEVAADFDIIVDSKSLQMVSENLSSVFTTKRSIVRFGNQLRFVLPSVYKETEFMDLCFMESLKYINEQGWLEVSRQKNNLLGIIPFIADEKERENAKYKAYSTAINAILYYFPERRAYVETVLRDHLFPKIHHYGINALSKAINNRIYFSQYFICGVPEGVIARSDAEQFAKLVWEDEDSAISWINIKMEHYPSDEIDRTSRLALEMVERQNSVEMAAKLCRVLSFSNMANNYTKSLVSNPTRIDITITVVIIPRYMVRVVDEQRIPERKAEAALLKEIYEKAPVNFCMNLFYGIYSDKCFVPEDEKAVFDVLKKRVLEQERMSIFEYSYFILQRFLLVWKKTNPKSYRSYIDSILKGESFDAGSFVVRSLQENSIDDRLTTVVAITNLFSDAWDSFLENLNNYKDKENKLYRFFVSNCNQIKKEIIDI